MYLERWTIDQLTETTATLLRSHCFQDVQARDADNVPGVVMAAELHDAPRLWSKEDDIVLEKKALTDFINGAIQQTSPKDLQAFREPRAIREGDVYWVLWQTGPELPESATGPDGTERFLAACRQGLQRVGDVTSAARQAAKVVYTQALTRRPVQGGE